MRPKALTEDNEIVENFYHVVNNCDYLFKDNQKAKEELPELLTRVEELESVQEKKEVIRDWYINHEQIRDAIIIKW